MTTGEGLRLRDDHREANHQLAEGLRRLPGFDSALLVAVLPPA